MPNPLHIRLGRAAIATVLAAALLALLSPAPGAQAFKVISTSGEGAGQTDRPWGLAVDQETGRLFVADRGNYRIDVFDSAGNFELAFGWGVANGAAAFQRCGPAAVPPTATCRKGLSGQGAGQFGGSASSPSPTALAVDNDSSSPSQHALYVVDLSNNRIQKFDPDGNFELMFGGGVNETKVAEAAPKAARDVCPIAPTDLCGKGTNGFGDGEFSSSRNIFVGVGPGGVVYVVDNFLEGGVNRQFRLQRFEPSGAPIGSGQVLEPLDRLAGALAVDPGGDFHVASEGGENAIFRYEVGGGAPSAEIAEATSVLAVDPGGNLFAARSFPEGNSAKRSIAEFDSSGAIQRRFGYGLLASLNPGGLAPYSSANGDIYESEREGLNRVLHIDFPDPGPIVYPSPCQTSFLGNTKATLSAEVNPEGKSTTVHVDYLDEQSYQSEGGWSSPEVKSSAESALLGADFVLHEAAASTGVLIPETTYRCRVVATNADAPGGVLGEEGTFTTLEPLEIGSTWASAVGTEAATLNAEVNPLGIPTTAHFQYLPEADYQAALAAAEGEGQGPAEAAESAFAAAERAPAAEELGLGAGEAFKAASAQVSGLQPGTSYRYRIIATDVLIAPKEIAGPARLLRTQRPPESGLPDARAYELVTPPEKNNAEVLSGPGVGASTGVITTDVYAPIQAAATSGEALTYTSWSAFAAPLSAPGTSQYLSRRAAAGWQTENIFPFGASLGVRKPPFRGFDPELAFGALVLSSPPHAGCPQATDNLYLRSAASGALSCLTPDPPGESGEFCLDYAGASADGSRAFFASNARYPAAPEGEGFSLYEWSAAAGLRLASILPSGNPAPPGAFDGTAFGALGGHCSAGLKSFRNVVSEDGSRAFWTYDPPNAAQPTQLLARSDAAETVQLDKRLSGNGTAGDGVFLAATPDGSKVLFSAPGALLSGAGADDLYLYDFDAPAAPLTDLTPGGAGLEGLLGAGEDLSRVYFAATAVLSGEEENQAGQRAEPGAHNIYLHDQGEIDFIARVGSDEAESLWGAKPTARHTYVTPDGGHLAFLSREAESLVGYDNTVAAGDHCQLPGNKGQPLEGSPLCPQAFLYDAASKTLTCASCDPSGARPTGPSELPAPNNSFGGPRYLSDDGTRLFFESLDALSLADQNGLRDVYEFELPGSGACTPESPAFDPASGGCHFLISSGKSTDESYLIDASGSARDVFFSTREPLSGWDPNQNYDAYDARVGGGFPEPTEPQICAGEACKAPPASAPPSGPSPATATFQGPGNQAARPPRRCPTGKVRKKRRCVKRGHRRRAHKNKIKRDRRPAVRRGGAR